MPCDMPTPCCVRKYNSLKDGVDRMDRLTIVWAVLAGGGGNTSSGTC